MNKGLAATGLVVAALVVAGGIYMVDIDQTEETRLPDVDVNVEGGNLPEFTAETGSISLTEEQVTVDVPDVDVEVSSNEETISVPGLEVTPPEGDTATN
ncbi:hypothetical protein [Cognatishimia sp. MH4019]|uniref:hypothetical protein n=1 Tax=Cognatishimia sp. MH4019 TaxID=2854030 RepID=UPI001CD23DA6|nr:hypothetical protein [Cognatishimia sp. MH4019]